MKPLVPILALLPLLAGCSSGLGPKPDYDPGLTAADFVKGIDNHWLPLVVGAHWVYVNGDERVEVTVQPETRTILGVAATVVRDTVTVDGEVVEDTYDWFGQDRDGNVWYLGEDTCEYEDGECVDRGGAWEWGVDGALPGIVMWAHPVANGTAYYQEFYWGEAIDKAAVIDTGRTITVPAGTFTDTVTTEEWNPLEGGGKELAHYARGVGVVAKEEPDEPGGGERLVEYYVPLP